MFGKIASFGAMLALLLSVGAARAADPKPQPGCCAPKTACCTPAKSCCTETRKAACCKPGAACCRADKACCASKPTVKSAGACPVTGLDRRQCCASKASPLPPCCMKGCDTAGRHLR